MESMSGEMNIEADGGDAAFTDQFDVDDEDLNAAFEAEHGSMFQVIDDLEMPKPKEAEQEKKKFVIPKIKRPENESNKDDRKNEEGKREWHKMERDRSKDYDRGRRDRGDRDRRDRDRDSSRSDRNSRDRNSRDRSTSKRDEKDRQVKRDKGQHDGESKDAQLKKTPQENSTAKHNHEERQSLFESFSREGLIPDMASDVKMEHVGHKDNEGGGTKDVTEQEGSHFIPDDDAQLEIPMGRDSLVFVRGYYPWQVRVHPVNKSDMARSDFAQIWTMADSSSIVWSSHAGFGGVGEFLLKDPSSIQKFMRKILWHNFASDVITVEVTEREKSDMSQQNDSDALLLDTICNQMVFKFNNTRARQLIKTYYPTPEGEVTERSVYVNNVNSGKAADLLKAVFPCAAKISVARSSKTTSSALVETANQKETFNYLVVYDQIMINNTEVLLSSVHIDWEGAKEQYEQTEGNKKKPAGQKQPTKPSPTTATKRAAENNTSPTPAKRGRGPTNQAGTSPKGGVSSGGGDTSKDGAKGGTASKDGATSKGGAASWGGATSRGGATSKGGAKSKGDRSSSRGGSSSSRGRASQGKGGASRGRGGPLLRGGPRGGLLPPGQGRTLLPDPPRGGGDGLLPLPPRPIPPEMHRGGNALLPSPCDMMGEGLLPHPHDLKPPSLLNIPVNPTAKGVIEGELLGPPDIDELYDPVLHLDVSPRLDTRPQLDRGYHPEGPPQARPQLDRGYRPEGPSQASRHLDYLTEELGREPARRTLLSQEERARVDPDDWLDDPAEYRRSSRPSPPAVSLDRRDSRDDYEYDGLRSAPRPYLLKPPVDDDHDRQVFDYSHAQRHSRPETGLIRDDRPLLSRPPLLDVDRREYADDQLYERRDFSDVDIRRPGAYAGYEVTQRYTSTYSDDLDRRY